MIVDLGGEDVTVLDQPVDGNWLDVVERVVTTLAPPEPHRSDAADVATSGWIIYLPGGDPIGQEDRVRLRGRTYSVQGQPNDWGDFIAVQLAAGTHSALVSLRTPGITAWSDQDEATTTTPAATYATSVPAGIQAQANRSDIDAVSAEESVAKQPYVVTLGPDVAPNDGDEVEVSACADDPSLVGRVLRVEHVLRGTGRFERQLLCTLIDITPTT